MTADFVSVCRQAPSPVEHGVGRPTTPYLLNYVESKDFVDSTLQLTTSTQRTSGPAKIFYL